MFDAAALNMRDDFARDLVRHEAEQGRVWRRQVLNTTVGNATGALIAGTDGNDAGYAAKARAALLTDGLGQGLSGEALDKQTNFAFGRRVVEPVVTARLSQGDVTGAKTFFYTHRDGMAGDDADILDRRLAEAGQAWNTKTIVDDLWQRLGPKSFDDPIDMDAIENDLVVRHGGDERALMRERDEVFHRILGFTQARDDTHAGYANFLINKVKGGASPSQIATLPQFLALPKDQQQQLIDWHREQMTDRLTGFAPDQNLDRLARRFAAYHDLSGDDALKQMSIPQVQAREPEMGEDLTRQALAQKAGTPSLDATDFAALARRIGVDPNPEPTDTLSRAQLGVIRSAADKAIASSGTALTPQQQRETALGAAQTAINGHPLFQLPPEVQRILDMTPGSVKAKAKNAQPASRPLSANPVTGRPPPVPSGAEQRQGELVPEARAAGRVQAVSRPGPAVVTRNDVLGALGHNIAAWWHDVFQHDAPASKPKVVAATPSKVAVGAGSQHRLGNLSMKEETSYSPGNEALAAAKVSSGNGDPGGISYGAYQLASSEAGGRNVQAFLKFEGAPWAARFNGLEPTAHGKFGEKWKEVAASDPKAFFDAQHRYIQRTKYDPAILKVLQTTGLDINRQPEAVQQVVWSMAVQHGKAARVITRSVKAVDQTHSRFDPGYAQALINSLYDHRKAYVLGQHQKNEAAIMRRYERERTAALSWH